MAERPRDFSDHPFWYTPPQQEITERELCEVAEWYHEPTIEITIADQQLVISQAEAERLYFKLKTTLGVNS